MSNHHGISHRVTASATGPDCNLRAKLPDEQHSRARRQTVAPRRPRCGRQPQTAPAPERPGTLKAGTSKTGWRAGAATPTHRGPAEFDAERTRREPAPAVTPRPSRPCARPDRQTAVAREKEQFGGIKVGSAFFGWLAATGTAVLLTAFVAAAGTAVGLATNTDVNEAVNQASSDGTVGLAGHHRAAGHPLRRLLLGGYVAGRMARFSGAKQGFMVWVWAVIFAVLIALLA